MQLKNKYVKLDFNVKTGAVVGLANLVLSTIVVATHSELREMPIEDKVKNVALATGILTLGFTTVFYIINKGINKINKYFGSNKVDAYFDRLARR